MESDSVEVKGIRMRWMEEGEGRPVVFVHGIPTSPRLWRRVVPLVSSGARALAWEMVGYGASIPEGRGRDISVARQAEYLASWMREVGLKSAVLVGHDIGGGVAQVLAVRRPELVEGLVLTNSVSYDSWPVPPVRALRAARFVVERLPDTVFRRVYGAFISGRHDNPARAKESIAEHWSNYEAAPEGAAAAFVRQARALDVRDTLDIAGELPNLDVPANLVWGTDDRYQEIGYGYRLAYELGARIERLEGAGHFVPEDHPEEIATAVNELLEQTLPERGVDS